MPIPMHLKFNTALFGLFLIYAIAMASGCTKPEIIKEPYGYELRNETESKIDTVLRFDGQEVGIPNIISNGSKKYSFFKHPLPEFLEIEVTYEDGQTLVEKVRLREVEPKYPFDYVVITVGKDNSVKVNFESNPRVW